MEAAAAKLHVTPSAISQRIKALETTVGRVLLARSRPLRPTVSGEKLLHAARQIEVIMADVAHQLGDEPPDQSRLVALAVNADSLDTWFVPALRAVSSPIIFDLRRADEAQTGDLLRDGTVMAAVTASARPLAGCTVAPLGRMRYQPRATRAFASRWFPHGVTAAQLAVAPMVCFDREDQIHDGYLRRRTRRPLDPPRHYVPSSSAIFHAVRWGLGWGMVPDLQTDAARRLARLVELDPNGSVEMRLYWQQWRLSSPTLDEVAQAIRGYAAENLR